MLGFTVACDDDELSTDQYTDGISLSSFGPSPIVRGGVLRFYGSNLDEIVKVVIPGVDAITDITVVASGKHSEIRVTVPVDGPEVGYVQLIASDGTTLTTASELTYTETIVFSSFSPSTADPGDVITIEGDYLNLIAEVIFSDGVIVTSDNFASQSRYTITVAVPNEAQSGVVTLADGDSTDEENVANLIESENELTVNVPKVTSFTADRFKAGETITIAGTLLNLVESIEFEGASVTDFTATSSKITLTQPAEAADGEVLLVLVSGVEVSAATLACVVPSDLAIASETVKNGLELTITGADLDLVTSITFPDSQDGGEFTYDGESTITVTAIPSAAVDGDIALNMANGMSATVAYTLVTPVVSGYSAESGSAGGEITLYGSDLDLVSTVSFGGSAATPSAQSETEITATIPMDSASGEVTLTLINGSTVTAPELSIAEASFCYVTEWPGEDVEIKASTLLTVTVANGDVLTDVQVNGTSVQYVLLNPTLYIALPDSAGKGTVITLISSNGEISYTIDVTPNSEVTTVIWEGAWDCGSWSGNQDLAWGGYDWSTVSAGTILTMYYTLDETYTWWQMRVANGSWAALPGTTDPYDLSGTTSLSVTLTQEMIDELTNNGGLVLTGCYYILSKITLTVITETATTVWEGSYDVGGWGGFSNLSWGGYDWSVLSVGDVLTAYYTLDTTQTYWQMRFGNGSWAALPGTADVIDLEAGSTSYSITITQEMIDELVNNGGLVMTGCYYILTKITYE